MRLPDADLERFVRRYLAQRERFLAVPSDGAAWLLDAAGEYADVGAMLDKNALLGEAGYLPYYLYRQKGTLQNLENTGYTKPGFAGLYNIYIMEE